jgi:hypothetical protein
VLLPPHLLAHPGSHIVDRSRFTLLEAKQHRLTGRLEQALETTQNRQRQDNLAILVPLVRSTEKIAD